MPCPKGPRLRRVAGETPALPGHLARMTSRIARNPHEPGIRTAESSPAPADGSRTGGRRPPRPPGDGAAPARAVRPALHRIHERGDGPLPAGLPHEQPLDPAGGRDRPRGHRGGPGLRARPRRPGARSDLRPLRPSAVRDRAPLPRRRRRHRDRMGHGLRSATDRGRGEAPPPEARRRGAGGHLHHHGPAARYHWAHLPRARCADLRRCHRLGGRDAAGNGRLAARRGVRRLAEMPVRPAGGRADDLQRSGGGGGSVAQARRAGDPPGGLRGGRRADHPVELLRPLHADGLLERVAAEPPHRGDLDALRGARMRPPRPRRRARAAASSATPARAAR